MAMGRTVALAAVFVIVSAASGSAQDDQDPYAPVDSRDFARNGFYVGLAGSLGIGTFKDAAKEDIQDELAALGYVDLGYRDPPLDPAAVVWVDFSEVQVDNMHLDLSIGANGRVGYRFHPNVSAELQAEWLAGFEANVGVSNLKAKYPAGDRTLGYDTFATVEVEPWVITGNVKGHLLTGPYQPFLLAGVGLMTSKVKRVEHVVGVPQPLTLQDSVGLGFAGSDRFTGFAARFGGGIEAYATEHFVFTLGVDYVLPTGDVKDLDYVSVGWGFQYRF